MNLRTLYKKLTNRKYIIGYKFILSLFVGLFGFINFGYCETVEDLVDYVGEFNNKTVNTNNYTSIIKLNGVHEVKSICVKFTNYQVGDFIYIGYSMNDNGTPNRSFEYANNGVYVCLDYYADAYLVAMTTNQRSKTLDGAVFVLNDLLTKPIPKLTSSQCQTEYNLIPIENVDQNYCEINGLCPEQNECNGTGLDWSALFINDIQFPGAPTIKITIPEEIERDQNTDEEETNIDVIGYGYDQDKMQQMVNTQYYKPTAEEMSGLMEKVADFLPFIAVALLITRIWRVIKKIF